MYALENEIAERPRRRMHRKVDNKQTQNFELCKKFLIDSVSQISLLIKNHILEREIPNGQQLIAQLSLIFESTLKVTSYEEIKKVVDQLLELYRKVRLNGFTLHDALNDVRKVYMGNEMLTLSLMFGLTQHGQEAFEQFDWVKWPKYF